MLCSSIHSTYTPAQDSVRTLPVVLCNTALLRCGDYSIVRFTSLSSWCKVALIIARNVLLLDDAIKTKICCWVDLAFSVSGCDLY